MLFGKKDCALDLHWYRMLRNLFRKVTSWENVKSTVSGYSPLYQVQHHSQEIHRAHFPISEIGRDVIVTASSGSVERAFKASKFEIY